MSTRPSARASNSQQGAGSRAVLAAVLVLLLAALGALPAGAAAPPEPTYGRAIVDGNADEWDVTVDRFAELRRAGQQTNVLEGWVYLRYDCASQTVYALAYSKDGTYVDTNPADNWIAIDGVNNKVVLGSSGNNGAPPDFQFVGVGGVTRGYEASFTLAPGTYSIIVHLAVFDDGQVQTARTPGPPPLVLNCELGSIGDYVWHDANADGLQNEPPANGLAGIRIRLLNADRTQVLRVVTTNSNGYYLFDRLAPATYVVDVNEQDVVSLYGLPTLTTPPEPHPKPLAYAEHYRMADFGYVAPPDKVALGDYVWNDFNSNGQQDFPAESPANAGVQCITIYLYDSTNQLIGHANTDSWGVYMFYGLAAGTYTTAVFVDDPDLAQIETWGVSKTCSLDDGVTEAGAASAGARASSPDDHFFTTPPQLTFPVAPAPMVELRYDYGLSTTPLAVQLASFQAEARDGYVDVTWETTSEIGNLGFNLYRSTSPGGSQQQLNAAMIPSQAPGSAQGAVYVWQDVDVTSGATYFYWLEDISFAGSTTLHGPASVFYQAPTAVTVTGLAARSTGSPAPLGTMAGAALAAVALLTAAGLARRRNR